MLQIGFSIPVAAPDAQPSAVVEFARRAEAAKAHSVWVLDRLLFHNLEPLISLGAIAATTTQVRLGTCVLIAAFRPPALVAKMVATLDQLSRGRVILGLGVGSRNDDFDASQVPFEHRGSRLAELIDILKLAWRGDSLKYSGRFYQMDTGPVGPRPFQQPHPPLWFGATAEPAFKRLARIGDGFIGGWFGGPAGFRKSCQSIQRHAEAFGRDPNSITPAALVYACVDDDRDRASAVTVKFLNHYYGPRYTQAPPSLMVGPADDCVRVANEYVEAGAKMLILGSVTSDLRYFDRLCEQVLPCLV